MKIIISFFLITIIIFSHSACKKDAGQEPVEEVVIKQSGKSILGVFVNPAMQFSEVIKIDSTQNTIYLRLSRDYDLTAIAPIITISPGATISPASGTVLNFNDPVTYTVKAEDGTTRTYTFITSLTKGQIVHRYDPQNSYITELEAYQSYCSNNNNNGFVSITLGGCSAFGDGVKHLVYFRFGNKYLQDNLVGTYVLSSTSSTQASVLANNGSYYNAIIDGTLKITKYDKDKKLISGTYTGKFHMTGRSSLSEEWVALSCEFINAQL